MSSIPKEKYEKMLHELFECEPICHQTLCEVVKEFLTPHIRNMCFHDSALRGGGYEEDILQNTTIRIIKHCIVGFFLREEQINTDLDEFEKWIFVVARNVKRDCSAKVRKGLCLPIDDVERSLVDEVPEDGLEENREVLRWAVDRVFAMEGVGVYKTLTWFAVSLVMLYEGETKIKSTDYVYEYFKDKTLFEMYDILMRYSKKLDWLHISHLHKKRIEQVLNEPYFGMKTGELKYHQLFTKKGGKGSISDWIYKINKKLKEKREK